MEIAVYFLVADAAIVLACVGIGFAAMHYRVRSRLVPGSLGIGASAMLAFALCSAAGKAVLLGTRHVEWPYFVIPAVAAVMACGVAGRWWGRTRGTRR